MTLFNVRLGQWMPNLRARRRSRKAICPIRRSSLRALLRELAGSTDDLGSDIYLSERPFREFGCLRDGGGGVAASSS